MPMRIYSTVFLFVGLLSPASSSWGVWDQFRLSQPSRLGGELSYIKVSPLVGGGPPLAKNSWFGYSSCSLGDLNGDGVDDLAVGAYGESYFSAYNTSTSKAAGAVYILFMSKNFTVNSYTRISGQRTNMLLKPLMSFVNNDNFGFSLTTIGDLDGDGVVDLAVGAPGTYVGSVYILFLNADGSVKGTPVLVRQGHANGPPQTYQGRFGSTVASVGDWDGDGVPDVAVTAGDAAAGSSKVYIMRMFPNATVKSYSTIGFGVGGGPDFENQFTNFGSTIVSLGDIDYDNITDLAIGARFNTDPGGSVSAGAVYICFMHANGTIKSFVKHGDVRGQPLMPFKGGDECGGGLANIGDLNLDQYGQKRPSRMKLRRLPSLPDLVVGCPQGRTGFDGGRIMVTFLQGERRTQAATGEIEAFAQFEFTKPWMPSLAASDQFGQSITTYYDVDNNGILDFVVGAPGDSYDQLNNETDTGAVYLILLERIPYEAPIIDLAVFYVLVTVLPGCYCICFIAAIVGFMYAFRHKEDEAEILAKQAGMSSVKLGESMKISRSARSAKVLPGGVDEGKELEAGEETKDDMTVDNEIAGDRPSSTKSDPSRPISPAGESVTKSSSSKKQSSSSKKSSKLIYHRQKTSLQTYSKKIDDYEDDERVDEYF